MPASNSGSEDEEIDEKREPNLWRDVEHTINDSEDPMDDVFISVLGSESNNKPTPVFEEFPKGKFADPLGILRMPPRTFVGKPQSIDEEQFDAVAQLGGLHINTNFSELVQGMKRLGRKLTSQEEDIKTLVKDNFDRFISCKDVIDGLYELITENEMSESGTGSRKVEQTCKEVQTRAHRVYDPLLARKAETDKIRQSLSILSRFSFLFTLPSKIAANIRDGEYDKAVQHYKKAASIFQDQAAISHISVFLQVFSEVENIVAGFRTTLYSALADPTSSFEAQERVIRILVDLARPSDFRLSSEKDPRDDPGWYYLNMAATRMISRLNAEVSSSSSNPTASVSSPVLTSPSIFVSDGIAQPAYAGNASVYRSVRSACGHVARHLPNLWKMGQHYLEGRFDPRNYGTGGDKGKEEQQAHPQQDKEKLDKNASVRIFFSDETSSVRVDSRKPCLELVELCLRRVEGDHSPDNYAIFTWIEKRRKKDGIKVIKITELGPSEKINKIHKKWGDKSGLSHKFLFKRKDEKFPKLHDPRTLVEDYTLEMRSVDSGKKSKEGKTGKKSEEDFHTLITSVLSVFAERVEELFFHDSDDDFDADLADSNDEQTEEWAFGKMRAQVLDVVTTQSVLQRAGMSEKYLLRVSQLVLKLCGHYVSRVCGQWNAEVALLYLSVPQDQSIVLDSSVGIPIAQNNADIGQSANHIPAMFAATTKFYLAQFKGIVSKGHPLLTQIQSAFGEALRCFADTLHHLAFNIDQEEDETHKVTHKIHTKLRIVSYILETRNMHVGGLWSHFNELFKLSSTHQVEEEVLSSPLEVLHHLGNMTIAKYVHDRLNSFNRITRYGILLAPATEWATAPIPTAVSEYAMSVLLNFVYVASELAILEPGSESYREHRLTILKNDPQELLEGTPSEVINKLIGGLVWGMMEGIRRNLKQLDGGSFSVSGVYQLRLDFCFLETILARYIERDSGITHAIHAQLAQMEEEAYQNGASEDQIDVDLDAIIEDTARRSVVLFSALTGNAETAATPNMATARRHIPKRAVSEVRSPPRKFEVSADLVLGNGSGSGSGKDRLADMMRRGTARSQESRSSIRSDPPASLSPESMKPKREEPAAKENGVKGTNKEREREKMEALRREREKKERDETDRKDKEREGKERERKEGASIVRSPASPASPASNVSGGEMTSREKALALRKEKERAKLNKAK